MRICVFCSSSSALDQVYNQAARELGRLIGEKGHSLVYGGSGVGTMAVLARAAKESGAHVLGVIPQRLHDYGLADVAADEIIVTANMATRKATMEAHADAFVALPGGFGTLEELTQVLTLKQLAYLQAPIVILNIDGAYQHLLNFFEELYGRQFAKQHYRQLYYVAQTPQEALEHIEHYTAPDLPRKWFV